MRATPLVGSFLGPLGRTNTSVPMDLLQTPEAARNRRPPILILRATRASGTLLRNLLVGLYVWYVADFYACLCYFDS